MTARLPMPGDPCSCCPSFVVPQTLVYLDGALVCVVCDLALRMPSLARECEALGRLMADLEAEGLGL